MTPEERIISDVKEFGWHVGLFEATENEPSFAYTIGLWKTFNHPDIIAFGLPIQTLHEVLNNTAEKVKEGQTIALEIDDFDILETLPVQFIDVDKNYIPEYFGYGQWFYDYGDFPAIQLVWPDRNGKFPWEEGLEEEFLKNQLLLN